MARGNAEVVDPSTLPNEFDIKAFTADPKLRTVYSDFASDAAHIYSFGWPIIDIPYGGGIYSGKIYEIWGWESQGKSTLALEIAKAFCNYWEKQGIKRYAVLWLETESAFDKLRAKNMGCNVDNFLISEVETVEEGEAVIMSTLDKATKTGTKLLIIWDTISAAPTANELLAATDPKKAWAGGMMEKPKMIRKILRNITTMLGKTDSTLVLVSQAIGGGEDASGMPESPSPAIKFHASVRTYVEAKSQIQEARPDGSFLTRGIKTQLYHYKNKLILPKQKSLMSLMGETGFDYLDTTLTFLMLNKLVKQSGSWKTIEYPVGYAVDDGKGGKMATELTEVKYQGNQKVIETIATVHPHLKDWLDYLVYKYFIDISPYIKVKLIKKVWEFEDKFFGKHSTELKADEIEMAKLVHKNLMVVDEEE